MLRPFAGDLDAWFDLDKVYFLKGYEQRNAVAHRDRTFVPMEECQYASSRLKKD